MPGGLDRDILTSLAGLEALALAGILLPLFVGHFLHPAAGLVLALVWWATPGGPVQILHDFRRGWYPFLAAYDQTGREPTTLVVG
jgi:hypothetical protein